MELGVETLHAGDTCTLAIEGDVDVYTSPRLKEQLVELVDGGCLKLTLDLDKVGFMDSSGLGVIVSALRRVREKGGTIHIVCTQSTTLRLFKITGLDMVLPIYSDRTSAARF
jgi:anti-sigma B factor antagonist